MTNHEPKILVYDIETTPLKAWTFRCGKQVVSHGNLDKARREYDIICITYVMNDGKPAKAIHWGHDASGSAQVTKKFDAILKNAQDEGYLVIGKNNKRFDDKHLNTHRWLNGHEAMPEWTKYTEDLESQLRRHFYLPSYSLDYVSELRGFGGKLKMELSDWTFIVNYKEAQKLLTKLDKKSVASICEDVFGMPLSIILSEGRIRLDKMVEYGKKDAEDTLGLIQDVAAHCEFKSNIKSYKGKLQCKDPLCGSFDIRKNGTRIMSGTKYQQFHCNKHGGYAGRGSVNNDGGIGRLI